MQKCIKVRISQRWSCLTTRPAPFLPSGHAKQSPLTGLSYGSKMKSLQSQFLSMFNDVRIHANVCSGTMTITTPNNKNHHRHHHDHHDHHDQHHNNHNNHNDHNNHHHHHNNNNIKYINRWHEHTYICWTILVPVLAAAAVAAVAVRSSCRSS